MTRFIIETKHKDGGKGYYMGPATEAGEIVTTKDKSQAFTFVNEDAARSTIEALIKPRNMHKEIKVIAVQT